MINLLVNTYRYPIVIINWLAKSLQLRILIFICLCHLFKTNINTGYLGYILIFFLNYLSNFFFFLLDYGFLKFQIHF